MMSKRSFFVFLRSSNCSARNFKRSSRASYSSRARGLIFPSKVSERSVAASRFSCWSRRYGINSVVTISPASFSRKVGTSFCGPYSLTNVVISTPNSSTALSSRASIRIRCSARAISSRCTLVVNCSNSVANSRPRARMVNVSPSRCERDSSSRARSVAAFAMERSM